MKTLKTGLLFTLLASQSFAKPLLVFVGAYADKPEEGISVYTMCDKTGIMIPTTVLGGQQNPSFLEVHPNGKFLYAVNEIANFNGEQNNGAISSYSLDPKTGKLGLLNQQPTHGAAPCHVSISKDGKSALVANYKGGSVVSYKINQDGTLSKPVSFYHHEGSSVTPRQKGPHGHSINLDPANKFAFAADLGLDKIIIYGFDPKTSKLTNHSEAALPPGSGPRHFAITGDSKFAYSLNELTSTVTAFKFDPEKGELTQAQTLSTLPTGYKGNNSTAEVRIHPNGNFLYCSNRGHDSVAVFKLNPKLGTLTPLQWQKTGGKTPRNFNITPDGQFLVAAHQTSNDIIVHEIDSETGLLTKTDNRVLTPRPVCIRFLEQN
jgi:6-phosphogluconolactonase